MNITGIGSGYGKSVLATRQAAEKAVASVAASNAAETTESAGGENCGIPVEISETGMQKYLEQKAVEQFDAEAYQKAEQAVKEGKEFGKVLTIFWRIANGDIVPARDEKKLMDYSKKLYHAAKAMAVLVDNDKPEEYESVEEEEEKAKAKAKGRRMVVGGANGAVSKALAEVEIKVNSASAEVPAEIE